MLASDDPRSYRHPTNAHEGQENSPFDVPANRWLKGRIRLVRDGMLTHVVPEVYVPSGDTVVDPATGVPGAGCEGLWMQLHDRKRRGPMRLTVLTGLPGGRGRLGRAVRVCTALFHARAIIPETVE